MASVTDAMMWLIEARQHVAEDDAPLRRAVEPRGGHEILGAQARKRPRTTRASWAQPISDRISVIMK